MPTTPDPVRTIRFDGQARTAHGPAPGPASGPAPGQARAAQEWYAAPDGLFGAGFWSGDVGTLQIAYDKDEMCILLAGRVRLTDAGGVAEVFVAGDTFVIPRGFRGTWETLEPVRKFYAIHRYATP